MTEQRTTPVVPVKAGGRVAAFNPQTFEEAKALAQMLAKDGDIVPEQFRGKPGSILAAMSLGAEKGFSPITALQHIAVINGRPSIWGDAIPALIQQHGHMLEEWHEGSGDNLKAVCRITRKDTGQEIVREFSVEDAKRAGLWETEAKVTRRKKGGNGTYTKDNDSPWWKYPKRMLQMRARGLCARDGVADVMLGLSVAEEQNDRASGIRDITPPLDEENSAGGFAGMAERARNGDGDKGEPKEDGETIEGIAVEQPDEAEEDDPNDVAIDPTSEAFKAGYQAYVEGFGRGDCPYKGPDVEYDALCWFAGYDEAYDDNDAPEEDGKNEEGEDDKDPRD